MAERSEQLPKIEPQIDEAAERLKAKIRTAVEQDEHLKALASIIKNKHYPNERLQEAVREWNSTHEFVNYQNAKPGYNFYEEEKFPGSEGRSLIVMMDTEGRIKLRIE